jgi:hypothetical protein
MFDGSIFDSPIFDTGTTSPYFDGCYFDPLYFDALACGGPITPGGHPGRTGRRGRPIVERNPVVDDDELFSGVI